MITCIEKNIYKIEVPLPNNPLKETNSYFIRGSRNLLIDTGFRCETSRRVLNDALNELDADRKITDIFVTHMHSDHIGLAPELTGPDTVIYISQQDYAVVERCLKPDGTYTTSSWKYYSEGFPCVLYDEMVQVNPARVYMPRSIDEHFDALNGGDRLEYGDYSLEILPMPGHTPGNTMLWDKEKGIMFTGDHILFDISPNIAWWPESEDSLGDYLSSLNNADVFDVRSALPGHRQTGDYHKRIEHLLQHHERRLAETFDTVCRNPFLNAYQLAGFLSWRIHSESWDDFPVAQKWFAVSETISHLDYLRKRKMIRRTREKGIWLYYTA